MTDFSSVSKWDFFATDAVEIRAVFSQSNNFWEYVIPWLQNQNSTIGTFDISADRLLASRYLTRVLFPLKQKKKCTNCTPMPEEPTSKQEAISLIFAEVLKSTSISK